MSVAKVAITLDRGLLSTVDRLIRQQVFPNRSRMIQAAVSEKVEKLEANRLARECEKLDKPFERTMADEGLTTELDTWPEY
ncbi:MAG: ribbon-helix-helix domain-containing protein [Verrucomicrobiota bacterium]|jgi:metal-responsive CopG/Arc/MetJ family transcriptional regulator|nr:ribbon-helix-helix domain-containing protein [Verrucomicrobiota bacterium]